MRGIGLAASPTMAAMPIPFSGSQITWTPRPCALCPPQPVAQTAPCGTSPLVGTESRAMRLPRPCVLPPSHACPPAMRPAIVKRRWRPLTPCPLTRTTPTLSQNGSCASSTRPPLAFGRIPAPRRRRSRPVRRPFAADRGRACVALWLRRPAAVVAVGGLFSGVVRRLLGLRRFPRRP